MTFFFFFFTLSAALMANFLLIVIFTNTARIYINAINKWIFVFGLKKTEKAMPIQFKYHWMFRFLYLYCNYIIYYLTLYLLFIILFNSDFNLHSDKEDVCLYKISIAIIIKITETVWCSNESGSPYFQYFDYWYKVTCTKLAVCLRNSKIKNKTMSPSCDPVRY